MTGCPWKWLKCRLTRHIDTPRNNNRTRCVHVFPKNKSLDVTPRIYDFHDIYSILRYLYIIINASVYYWKTTGTPSHKSCGWSNRPLHILNYIDNIGFISAVTPKACENPFIDASYYQWKRGSRSAHINVFPNNNDLLYTHTYMENTGCFYWSLRRNMMLPMSLDWCACAHGLVRYDHRPSPSLTWLILARGETI